MIPHLQNVLETIPASVAISAIFDRWDLTMWNTVSMEDVKHTFTDPFIKAPTPAIRAPILQQPEGISLLFHHQYWARMAADFPRSLVATLSDKMKYTDLQQSTGLRFVIPFSILDVLWSHEDPHVRAQSLQLLSLLEQSWQLCPGYDGSRYDDERVAFIETLVKHINRTDRVSELSTSKRGQAFIRFIHNQLITRQYFRYSTIYYTWPQAISRVQEIGGLPSDYFAPIPENRWDPPPTLPTLDSVRYSIETESGVQVGNEGVLDIVTANGMGDSFGGRPTEGGLVRRLGAWFASYSSRETNESPIMESVHQAT
ncbi:hypothetical protein MPER_11295 [Moniliophthora perniciosa FA553]|nr:hypothetical protein MPER_11295 [Moniliophthora perniciosa FA553]